MLREGYPFGGEMSRRVNIPVPAPGSMIVRGDDGRRDAMCFTAAGGYEGRARS